MSKIFRAAHCLPVSSACVEQSFSSLKLIRSNLRTRLSETTVEALVLIHENFSSKTAKISDEMIQEYAKIKAKIIARKSSKAPHINVQLNKQTGVDVEDSTSQNTIENETKRSDKKRRYSEEGKTEVEPITQQIKFTKEIEEDNESSDCWEEYQDDISNVDKECSQEENYFEDLESEENSYLSSD